MRPGDTEDFFQVASLGPFAASARNGYCRDNALWLMEFSRLIYRQENDEVDRPAGYKTRNSFLQPHGWNEAEFFNTGDTQAGWFVNPVLKCAVLVFRGTLGIADTITDLEFDQVTWSGPGKVHVGFNNALADVWDDVLSKLIACQYPVFFTGHSLGAALATLAAARCLQSRIIGGAQPAAIYTFGSPRVGGPGFHEAFGNLFHCRVVNDEDIIPTLPPKKPDLILPPYHHVGQMHRLEKGGHLHVFPSGADAGETWDPIAELEKMIHSVKCARRSQPHVDIRIPKPLCDHTPVNYTAHLEKAS